MSVVRSELPGGFGARVNRVRSSATRRPRRLALVASLALALSGGIAWLATSHGRGGPAASAGGVAAKLTVQQIIPPLTRSGVAPTGVEVDATYAPQVFFQVTGRDLPAVARSKPSLVFFLQESVHEGFLPAAPPTALLRVDSAARVAPYAIATLSADDHHRLTRLLFPATAAGGSRIAEGDAHTFAIVLPDKHGAVSEDGTLTWRVPVALPTAAAAPKTEEGAAREAASGAIGLSALTRALHKSVGGVSYGGVEGVAVDAIYATPQYFKDALPADAAAHYTPDRSFVFVVTASSHTRSLPNAPPPLVLHVGGKAYRPDLQERKIWSPHHQVVFLRFPADAKLAEKPGVMSLQLSDGASLRWALPVSLERGGSLSPFGIPWASILALLGGFLGAMWPCLFQLTVFFMPTLAGVGAEHAAAGDHRRARRQIARAAFYFVLGFTIVYTAAGALIGYAAQKLHSTSSFETYQRYFGIVAGLVILVLAARVAIRGRAPLVCKMPIAPRMSRKSGATPGEMMMAGLAFATGCMTCFGSAIVIGMVVYVGLSNSALYGAFILLIFSLGMGIPLGIAAMAMGRIMPLLGRMEKAMPWMALTSAAIMIGYGVLLISGNYMALSSWLYRLTG